MKRNIVNAMRSYCVWSLRESDKSWTKMKPEFFFTPRRNHASTLIWFLFVKFSAEVQEIEEIATHEIEDFELIEDQAAKYFKLIFKSPHEDRYCRYGIAEVNHEI